jgi:hypothetical protein
MIRHTLIRWSGALATSALLLAGCGRSREASPTPGPSVGSAHGARAEVATAKAPCTLLTRAEVEKAMGEPVAGEGSTEFDECTWTGAAHDDDKLSLDVDDPAVLRQVVTGNGGGGHVANEPVVDVGDEALYQTNLKILFFRKGTTGFTIQIATEAGAMARSSEKDHEVILAKAVLGRL